MDLLQASRISATGLTAQRTKMKVIAENLANVETTRTPEGGPYRRKMVVFSEKSADRFQEVSGRLQDGESGVEVTEIIPSSDEFRQVFNPNHPDTDPDTGYVTLPNINLLTEMADMMLARRAYDANVSVMSNTKAMINRALEIGK